MNTQTRILVVVLVMQILSTLFINGRCEAMSEFIELPHPRSEGPVSVEAALNQRRSVRYYQEKALTIQELSQLLWAAQGITHSGGYRTAPSAGALYPLEVFAVVGNVEKLDPGVYRYMPRQHQLAHVLGGDRGTKLCEAALGQMSVKNAPVVLVFCAVYERITGKYGERGIMYTHMEAGHAAQNVSLQAVSLGLGTVPIGAFRARDVGKALKKTAKDEYPLYLMPVGRPEK